MDAKSTNQININEFAPAIQGHTLRLQISTCKVCSETQVFTGDNSYADDLLITVQL